MEQMIIALILAFNEAENILCVIDEVRESQPDMEMFGLNDASTDNTAEAASITNATG